MYFTLKHTHTYIHTHTLRYTQSYVFTHIHVYSYIQAHFPTALKEFEWRNQFFLDLTRAREAAGACPCVRSMCMRISVLESGNDWERENERGAGGRGGGEQKDEGGLCVSIRIETELSSETRASARTHTHTYTHTGKPDLTPMHTKLLTKARDDGHVAF